MKIKELRTLFNKKDIKFSRTTKLKKLLEYDTWNETNGVQLYAYYIYFPKDDIKTQYPHLQFVKIKKIILIASDQFFDPDLREHSFIGAVIFNNDGSTSRKWIRLDESRLFPRTSKIFVNAYNTNQIRKYYIRRIE